MVSLSLWEEIVHKRRSTITFLSGERKRNPGRSGLTDHSNWKKRNNGSRTGRRTHATSEPEEVDNSPGETSNYTVSRVGGNNCGQTNRICRIVLRISPFGVVFDVLETDLADDRGVQNIQPCCDFKTSFDTTWLMMAVGCGWGWVANIGVY